MIDTVVCYVSVRFRSSVVALKRSVISVASMSITQDKPSQTQFETGNMNNVNGMDNSIDDNDNPKYETDNPVDGDIGLQLFANHRVPPANLDPKAERRLVRKIDMFIIPFICVTYLITIIDKATLGYGQSYESRAREEANRRYSRTL